MEYIRANSTKVNGVDVEYFKINNDVNGNPRYVIHFLNIAETYNEALKIARKIGGRAYKAKWFGGGIVISSYSLQTDLKYIIGGVK